MTLIITNVFEWVMLTLRCAPNIVQKRCQVVCFNAIYSPLNANFILCVLSGKIIEDVERNI